MLSRRLVRVLTAAAMAVGGALVAPVHHADAAASVPAVSNLRPYARYDHTLRAQWDVPAAAYAPGARVVVRYTRGLTAAATPDAGYAATWVQYARVAEARPLLASTTYTFAVWVRDAAGHLSQRHAGEHSSARMARKNAKHTRRV